MKKYILGLTIIVNTTINAQVNKDIYIEKDVINNKIINSNVKYDVNTLQKQLEHGTSTIKGKVYAAKRSSKTGGKLSSTLYGVKNADKVNVYLIPYTDYIKDYIKLKKTSEKPKKNIYVKLHDEVYKYRLEGITNSNGEFTFPNIKPGKYYIFSNMKTITLSNKKYYSNGNIATDAYGRVISEGYSSHTDYKPIYDYVDNIVEVLAEQSNVNVKVSNLKKDKNLEFKEISK